MTVQRYLDAIVTYEDSPGAHDGVSVMIPLADDDADTPTVLHDPLPGMLGTWHRETAEREHPARYVRVDPGSAA